MFYSESDFREKRRKIRARFSSLHVIEAKLPYYYGKLYTGIQNLASLEQKRSLRKVIFCL